MQRPQGRNTLCEYKEHLEGDVPGVECGLRTSGSSTRRCHTQEKPLAESEQEMIRSDGHFNRVRPNAGRESAERDTSGAVPVIQTRPVGGLN